MSFSKQNYENAKKTLMETFGFTSSMQIPKIEKVVINMGLGEASGNSKILDEAVEELKLISGQKPIVTKARGSIAGFKIREGQAIGCKVTLRGENMYNFIDKLLAIALPRVRDFQGLNQKAFDGQGNYTLGISEQSIFPEIDYDKISKVMGMDITVVTSAANNEEGLKLLELVGFPFNKRGE